jgi:predicted esterase YcpF (UPF0227 family)
MKTLVYLHGFRSSSQSRKAQQLGEALRSLNSDWEYITPDLSFDPAVALGQIEAIVSRCVKSELTLIGSSLGGYYAEVCAEKFDCRAVLLNPSLAPYETLAAYIGHQTNLYRPEESFDFTHEHLDALRRVDVAAIKSPEKYLVVVEMGDALLDHRRTLEKFAASRQVVVDGGTHDLDSFPRHIGAVLQHAGLMSRASA